MTKKSWYRIHAAGLGDGDGGHAEILIYDEIGRDIWGDGIAADELVLELADLDVATLDVRINSVGGIVFEGVAIYNALDRHPARVTTHVDGMAASIASIVAMAGDERRIAANAVMMIHNPWGFEIGDAGDLRKMADRLDTIAGTLVDTYVARSGQTANDVRAWMDSETWFNAEESLEAGLVDEIDARMEIAASFDLSRFGKVPDDVRDRWAAVATLDGRRAVLEEHGAGAEPAVVAEGVLRTDGETGLRLDTDGPDPEVAQVALKWAQTLARIRK